MIILTKTVVLAWLGMLNTAQASTPPEGMEELFGIGFQKDSVVVQVVSNGCTKPDHFRVEVEQQGNDEVGLSVIRMAPDRCRRRSEIVKLRLPMDVKPNRTIHVLNAFKTAQH